MVDNFVNWASETLTCVVSPKSVDNKGVLVTILLL